MKSTLYMEVEELAGEPHSLSRYLGKPQQQTLRQHRHVRSEQQMTRVCVQAYVHARACVKFYI